MQLFISVRRQRWKGRGLLQLASFMNDDAKGSDDIKKRNRASALAGVESWEMCGQYESILWFKRVRQE